MYIQKTNFYHVYEWGWMGMNIKKKLSCIWLPKSVLLVWKLQYYVSICYYNNLSRKFCNLYTLLLKIVILCLNIIWFIERSLSNHDFTIIVIKL